MVELLSIDVSNYCSKQCSFCYNHSRKNGNTMWTPDEIVSLAADCVKHGMKAVSLGGGEPFEYDGIFDVIDALYPLCYLSVTTNGLPLENDRVWAQLIKHSPDKVHVTIHQPQNEQEVSRVTRLLKRLASTKIKPGLNLLVGADKVKYAKDVYAHFRSFLQPDQIILVPQRYGNTPTAKQLALVADNKPFQSPSCLLSCKRPQRFVSVTWDKQVCSCSYAPCKQPLRSLDFKGISEALAKVEWKSCQI